MHALLRDVDVVIFGSEPAQRAGRVLADLGATVTRVAHHKHPDPLHQREATWLAWTTGSIVRRDGHDGCDASTIARTANIVIDSPHDIDTVVLDPDTAPHAHWIHITPFGMTGPRAHWRATDLGVMAASGNLFATGDPDRAPVRAVEPTSYAHVAGEVAFAAISALTASERQIVDVSIQECVTIANMGSAGRFFRSGARGQRSGARLGATREIWPTIDGFVSFGIRGGAARAKSMATIATLVHAANIDDRLPDGSRALEQDWSTWSQNTATAAEFKAMERAIGAYFASMTMQSLYDIAVETNLMLAPAVSPREVMASQQLAARGFLGEHAGAGLMPKTFFARRVTAPKVHVDRVALTQPTHQGIWAGTNIVEFGSGAAGPIATRYFVEHGATVLRIESAARPDFLRAMVVGPANPHGLEGSELYDALNCGKRHLTLNLKDPEGIALAKRLIFEWADAVAENYAPRAMAGFGLDYDTLANDDPSLVMISACLNGQTGPHRDYPGFGGQGSALSGWNWLTGWPDREPVGPFGTITDSLAPRYVAAALAAALVHKRATGEGSYIDISQVETGLYALSPWLIDFARSGTVAMRDGNRSQFAAPHGVFPCADEQGVGDRWIALACHTDEQWSQLSSTLELDASTRERFTTTADRLANVDELEQAISAATQLRNRAELATALQAVSVEAVPVADFCDAFNDPQLAHRGHYVAHEHPYMGDGRYERNGIRFGADTLAPDATPHGYWRAGPTLGQDNAWAIQTVLGLDADTFGDLIARGVIA